MQRQTKRMKTEKRIVTWTTVRNINKDVGVKSFLTLTSIIHYRRKKRNAGMCERKDENCAYCMEGSLLAEFGIKICELKTAKVYLFKEQSHKGRVIVAHKKHVGDMKELTEEERSDYFTDIARVSKALQEVFRPQKVNYGAYGDTGHHLHFHLVPKYREEYEWGNVFAMNPGKTYCSQEEYDILVNQIRAALMKDEQ